MIVPTIALEFEAIIRSRIGPDEASLALLRAVLLRQPRLRTVTAWARVCGVSRRVLRNRLAGAGLHNGQEWLSCIHVVTTLAALNANPGVPIELIASEWGWPDPFTLSNAMLGRLGGRPSVLRHRPWQAVFNEWIDRTYPETRRMEA